jgi:hypothetical protein
LIFLSPITIRKKQSYCTTVNTNKNLAVLSDSSVN